MNPNPQYRPSKASRSLIRPLALALAFAFVLPASGGFETWTNKDGKKASLELIRLIDKDGEKAAEFKMPDGKTVVLKLSALSEVDAKRALEAAEKSPSPAGSAAGGRMNGTKDIASLFSLGKLPSGAKDFIIGSVVWQPKKGLLWWSGGFLKEPFNLQSSPDECLPGLVRINPATGDFRILTAPSGWISFDDDNQRRSKASKPEKSGINPWNVAVHVNGDRVVWHASGLGLWEVDGERMDLKPLVEKVGCFPMGVFNAAFNGAFVGEAFCYAERDPAVQDAAGWFKESGARRVCCVRPGGKREVLVETSRRPEITLLDATNTELAGLVVIDGTLWVLANTEWVHRSRGIKAAGFPGGGLEGLKTNTDQHQVEAMVRTMTRATQPYHPQYGKWGLGEGFSVTSSFKPGRLPVIGPAGEKAVPIELPVPKSAARYRVKEIKDDGSIGEEIEVDLDDFVNGGYSAPVIIGETDKVLYLMASKYDIYWVHLPILWTVSKDWLRTKAGP